MRFEFPTGEVQTEFGPLPVPALTLPVKTPTGHSDVRFLLDSGADITMLSRGAGEYLGIFPQGAPTKNVSGIEGRSIPAWVGEITVRIGNADHTIPCLFTENEKTPFLLGRIGLFQKFNVTFDNRQKKIILESIA